jgi:hypothetical protein
MLFGKLKGKDHLGDPRVDGWNYLKPFITVPDSTWEPFAITHEQDNELSNLKFAGEFHNQFTTISFSRKTLLDGARHLFGKMENSEFMVGGLHYDTAYSKFRRRHWKGHRVAASQDLRLSAHLSRMCKFNDTVRFDFHRKGNMITRMAISLVKELFGRRTEKKGMNDPACRRLNSHCSEVK